MLSGLLQKLRFVGVVLSAMLVAAWTAAASAEESGHWKAKGVLVVTSQPTVKVADQSDHQLMFREFDGIVFNEGDKPFLDNARYQVVDLDNSGGMVSGGYKTLAAGDGSQYLPSTKRAVEYRLRSKVSGRLWDAPKNTRASAVAARTR